MTSHSRSGPGLLSLLPLLPLAPLAAPLAMLAVGAFVLSGCAAGALSAQEGQRKVAGRVFVVTGASSGFGRGVALKLGGYGGHVVLAARRAAVLEEVAAQVRAAGGQALVVPTDVASPEEMQRLAEAAVARFGRIDAWINNAGVSAIGPFEDVPLEDHARIVDVNLKGVIHGSHVALRQFRRQGHGVLVNLGSVESQVPLPYHASYAATKHAILGLDKALAQELRLSGARDIHVTTVMPWGVDTPFWDHAGNDSGRSPRMVALDGPEQTVDAIVWAAIHPGREMPVGWKARGALLSHQIWPGLAERVAANIAHRAQMEDAPPAGDRPGSLHEPMAEGVGVGGTTRARMEREDAARGGAVEAVRLGAHG
ncbi:SDR family NAD(P)-dependent oxidoreductase [Roseomonas marmotae]|uniref:SDR family oxidoreductase n=1 Tax=Roseomonas marmotae TaxID=2768161 RepID=UPI001BB7840B|nr:SDR family oxidoreductase [Roseomonas marmotae]QTI79367.1 SDR family NAD(P)-dependent oxidoreductase [Roseomonas marmotae]